MATTSLVPVPGIDSDRLVVNAAESKNPAVVSGPLVWCASGSDECEAPASG